jgi:hypothetical protein
MTTGRDDQVWPSMFHAGATLVRRDFKRVRVKQRPPAELIWETMRCKGWAVIDLADRMDGDKLRNRSLLSMLFRDPSGRTVMGSVFIHQVATALDLKPARLQKLEEDWIAYREKLSKSGRRLVGESWRRRRSPQRGLR